MRKFAGRPLDVVRLAADGMSIRETAEALGVTTETVKDYRDRAFNLLNANNMAHAVAIAARQGYLPGVRVVEAV